MSTRTVPCLGRTAKILLLTVGLISEYGLRQSIDDANWVSHTHEILTELQGLFSAVRNAEDVELSDILIGDKDPHRRFYEVQQRVMNRFSRLRALTADDPLQRRKLNDLRPVLLGVLSAEETAVVNRQKNSGGTAISNELSLRVNRNSTQQIQNWIEQLRMEELRLLRKRGRASNDSFQPAAVLVALGTVLVISFVALSTLVVNRDAPSLRG